jgi:hypothetical protein
MQLPRRREEEEDEEEEEEEEEEDDDGDDETTEGDDERRTAADGLHLFMDFGCVCARKQLGEEERFRRLLGACA